MIAYYLFSYFVFAVICGSFTFWLAQNKGYSGANWFLLGFLFSFVALIALAGAQSQKQIATKNIINANSPTRSSQSQDRWKCPNCERMNLSDIYECEHCGFKLQ